MRLSIVIPVYNVEKYIKNCIESILLQLSEEIELIIVDDGSTDESLEIIKKLIECNEQHNIKLIIQSNKGVSAARNNALKCSGGDYIAFVDSDDCINGFYVSEILNAIKQEPDIITFNYLRFSNDKELVSIKENEDHSKSLIDLDVKDLRNQKFKEYLWYPWLSVYKKKLIKADFFPINMCFEDVAVIPYIYLRNVKAIKIDVSLYYYRDNPSSITNNLTLEHLDDWYKVKQILKNYILHNGENVYTKRLMFKAIQAIRIKQSKLGERSINFPVKYYFELTKKEYRMLFTLGDIMSMLPLPLYNVYAYLKSTLKK